MTGLVVASRYTRAVAMDAVIFHIILSLCLRLCRKLQRVTQNTSIFVCCLRRQGICFLPHENLLSINEVLNNFLILSVRIQVQNNQNKSRDSPPCMVITCFDTIFGEADFRLLQQFSWNRKGTIRGKQEEIS